MTLPAWLPVVALVWLLAVLLLPFRGSYGNDPALAFYFEKYIFPWHLALVMGYQYSADPTGQWAENKNLWLIALGIVLLFFLFVQIFRNKKPLLFLRDVITEGALFAVAYGVDLLVNGLRNGFLRGFPSIILIPVEFIMGGVLLALLPISFILWLIPTGVLHKHNELREADERKNRNRQAVARNAAAAMERKDMDAPLSVRDMPSVITGPYGNKYRLINMNSFSAEYQSEYDSSIVTIHDSDVGVRSAKTSDGYFYW